MKVIIKVTHSYFEYDSCHHKEEEQIGIVCESFEKNGDRIIADGVIISIPPYHDGLDIDIVPKFWWEKSILKKVNQ